jgi:hypothetical protein
MFHSGVGLITVGILGFGLGAVCGAKLVFWLRHVTTKALHAALLNVLNERTATLDRLSRERYERPKNLDQPVIQGCREGAAMPVSNRVWPRIYQGC